MGLMSDIDELCLVKARLNTLLRLCEQLIELRDRPARTRESESHIYEQLRDIVRRLNKEK